MFAPRKFRTLRFRFLALLVVTAVIAVVTAFDYDPRLPFSLGESPGVEEEAKVLALERAPDTSAAAADSDFEEVNVLALQRAPDTLAAATGTAAAEANEGSQATDSQTSEPTVASDDATVDAHENSQASEENVLAGESLPDPETAGAAEVANASFELVSIGEFDSPVEVVHRPHDSRDFVVEQGGRLVAVGDGGAEIVVDVSQLTSARGEQGLLGAAFDPDAPFVYLHYTDSAGHNVLDEFAIDPASGIADPASRRTVLRVEQPYENHNGGELTFGPDGYVYLGLGDGGLADDPVRAALDLSSRLGKILRIDPAMSDVGAAFTIPDDNPFANSPDIDPTIWSYGLRNPWKFSFDSATGDLWIADVGQNRFEEINMAPATDGVPGGQGISFGWSAFEGNERFNDDQDAAGHTDPFLSYARDEGRCSVSGGALYRGDDLPLDGWFVFGDYCTGSVWAFDATDASADPVAREIANVGALVAVVADGAGGLLVVSNSGGVYRVQSS